MTCQTNALYYIFFTRCHTHALFISRSLYIIFGIFNLSFVNSSEIYNDSLAICFNGLYSNQLLEMAKQNWQKEAKRETERESRIFIVVFRWCCKSTSVWKWESSFRSDIFAKHALMKINNKSFPLCCWIHCLMSAIIFYGFSHIAHSSTSWMRNRIYSLPNAHFPHSVAILWIEKESLKLHAQFTMHNRAAKYKSYGDISKWAAVQQIERTKSYSIQLNYNYNDDGVKWSAWSFDLLIS